MSDNERVIENAGPSTDQHITGEPETGEFQTDKAPATDTPADGSSNKGINRTQPSRTPLDD